MTGRRDKERRKEKKKEEKERKEKKEVGVPRPQPTPSARPANRAPTRGLRAPRRPFALQHADSELLTGQSRVSTRSWPCFLPAGSWSAQQPPED